MRFDALALARLFGRIRLVNVRHPARAASSC
jgi:hypothetical protein